MANTTNTTSYLDPPSLIGRQNNDGTISLTPLELKRLNDFNYAVSKMIQGGLNLANLNADTNQVFTDIEGNVTTLQATAAGLQSSVADADGKATTALQTAEGLSTSVSNLNGNVSQLQQTSDGLSSSVSNLSGQVSTVSQTVNGLSIEDAHGSYTIVNGDKLRSHDYYSGQDVFIQNGSMMTGANAYVYGYFRYDAATQKVYLGSALSKPIKIGSDAGISIDGYSGVYIGTGSPSISIGGSGRNVYLNGNVYINGVLQ